jgi:plasmid maintenance system antidote protein VapI
MAKQEITEDEIKGIIEEMVKKWGSQRKVADQLEISAAFLSDILNGNRPVSNQVAQRLGYQRVIKFRKEQDHE